MTNKGQIVKLKALSYFHALAKLKADHSIRESEVKEIKRSIN
jgi:hypothetical protein